MGIIAKIIHKTIANKKFAITFYPKKIELFESLNNNVLFKQMLDEKTSPKYQKVHHVGRNHYTYFEHLQEKFFTNEPIDYLEFGVYKGESILDMAKLNKHSDSRFFGFDTFTGFPEDWKKGGEGNGLEYQKGGWTANNQIPKTDDERIEFIQGAFQDTLDDFLKQFTPKNKLVIHMDADMYTSSLFVLGKLDSCITKNTIIMFDQFGDLNYEFRAWYDYTRSFHRNYEIICSTGRMNRVAMNVLS
jgi:hypothetical protein